MQPSQPQHPQEARPPGSITVQLEELDGSLSSVERALEDLTVRMDPLLCSSVSKPVDNTSPDEQEQCGVAIRLTGFVSRLLNLRETVTDLCSRLDV